MSGVVYVMMMLLFDVLTVKMISIVRSALSN